MILIKKRISDIYWGGIDSGFNSIIKKMYVLFRIRMNGSFIGNPKSFKTKPIFPHGISGIFISEDAIIGEECIIFHQVTIGSSYLPGSSNNGAPVIGDNCYIGAGAKIIGDVKVGNNCRIGAGTVVVTDIPDNSTVVSGKPLILQTHKPINRYYMKGKEGWIEVHNDKSKIVDIEM